MLKLLFLNILALLSFVGAAQINLSVQNYSGNAILAKYIQGKAYPVDTLKGEANYTYNAKLDKGIYLFLLNDKYFEFPVGSDQSFSLKVDNSKELLPSLKVEGSPDNLLFQEFIMIKEPEQKNTFLSQHLLEIKDPFFKAYMNALNPVNTSNCKNDTTAFYYNRKHYWDNTNLTVGQLLNSPLITAKIDYYFNHMFVQDPDTVIKAISGFMAKQMADTIKQAALSFLLPYTFESKVMGMEKSFVWLAENFFIDKDIPWINDKTQKTIREQYLLNKYCLIGEKGHNLTLTKNDGSPFNLYEQYGDFTLLLFYDVSCNTCKKMVHDITEKSTELFLKGIDIVALNTETDKDKWNEFIQDSKITDWINVMDMDGSSNYHTLYGVQVTPTVYLLDKNKTIIGKKLTVDQVLQVANNYNP